MKIIKEDLALDVFLSLTSEYFYKNRANIIGKLGDFVTAPEASQMFCHAVGVWVYQQIVNFTNVVLVELGPGYGTLISEILQFLKQDPQSIVKIKEVFLVETSPQMILKQQETLKKHHDIKFNWIQSIDELDKLSSEKNIVLVANEFFDAIPIKQFIKINQHFHEIFISKNSTLNYSNHYISDDMMSKIMQYSQLNPNDFDDGDIYELSTASLSILNFICSLLKNHLGSALIIDYGYIQPKKRNTIQAIFQHKILDNFMSNLGEADISAQVDFGSMLKFINLNYPTFICDLVNQKEFLAKHHIKEIVETAKKHAKDLKEIHSINFELNKISEDMGYIFKALEINHS
jgi:NADH dehydrogenase [ubiquinone] 1 alpha subcomplex assembly factor 7